MKQIYVRMSTATAKIVAAQIGDPDIAFAMLTSTEYPLRNVELLESEWTEVLRFLQAKCLEASHYGDIHNVQLYVMLQNDLLRIEDVLGID